MTLSDIQFIFNRALQMTFNARKLFFMFVVLALSGILVVFFRGLAVTSGLWVTLSLTFLPIFLLAGVLMSAGILLIRIYHDEMKKKPVSYREVLAKSWEIVIGASYFSVPIVLCYLLLWMLLGIFFLLRQIPGLGDIIGVILSFAPFLINLGTLVLCVLNIAVLFFVTPIVALKGLNRTTVTQTLAKRFKTDIFSNCLLGMIATFPLVVFVGLLVGAAILTGSICQTCDDPLHTVLQWFFIMIPFTAFLSPAVVFFFNFAAESHVLLNRLQRMGAPL